MSRCNTTDLSRDLKEKLVHGSHSIAPDISVVNTLVWEKNLVSQIKLPQTSPVSSETERFRRTFTVKERVNYNTARTACSVSASRRLSPRCQPLRRSLWRKRMSGRQAGDASATVGCQGCSCRAALKTRQADSPQHAAADSPQQRVPEPL